MKHNAYLVVLAALSTQSLFAQSLLSPSANGDATVSIPTIGIPRPPSGLPYSAVEVSEMTLAPSAGPGSQIQERRIHKLYRDSQGRIRREFGHADQQSTSPTLVEVIDPIAQLGYILEPSRHLAHRFHLRPLSVKSRPGDAARPESNATTEALGLRVVEGQLAVGQKVTTRFDGGNASTRSASIETWVVPDVKVSILTSRTDSNGNVFLNRLLGFSRAEPAQSLFEPPPDYQVVEEYQTFTIRAAR